MRQTAPKRLALAMVCAVALITGCTDHQKLKQDMLQAVQKQEQARSYRFTGELQLQLDASLFAGAQPLTAAMATLLKDSAIAYTGAAAEAVSGESVRFEADMTVTPKNGAQPILIPALIKDNKLYLALPVFNKPDEFTVLPLGQGDNAAASGETLKNTGHLSAVLSGKLLEGIDPAWINEDSEPTALADGTPGRRLRLELTAKNEQAAADYFAASLPGALAELAASGLQPSAGDALGKALANARLKAPSSLTLLVDGQGFIREQTGELRFSLGDGPASALKWTQRLSDINGQIDFRKDVPKQTKPLDDLLRLLPKAPAASSAR